MAQLLPAHGLDSLQPQLLPNEETVEAVQRAANLKQVAMTNRDEVVAVLREYYDSAGCG